ncbi:unnamed protein product [Paramecium sonneborni]|uniref:Uncharacterized protein n=1 Tax=Paramecium sonneborni TaxID=65129 RepID=A0A8S1NKD7_9CILI|nr:unnamed protein product [Paramecium sonneborni]
MNIQQPQGKQQWPECVGKTAEKLMQLLPYNSMVTMDYRMDRVRVLHDGNGVVQQIPHVG